MRYNETIQLLNQVDKIINKYTTERNYTIVTINNGTINNIKSEILKLLDAENFVPYGHLKVTHTLLIKEHVFDENTLYELVFHVIKDKSVIEIINYKTTLKEHNIKTLKFSDVAHLSLYQLFLGTEYEDNLKLIFDKIVNDKMAIKLKNPLLVCTSDDDYNINEKQFFEKLNKEERKIFEYAQACNFAHNFIQNPLNKIYDEDSLGLLNSYCKHVKFVK